MISCLKKVIFTKSINLSSFISLILITVGTKLFKQPCRFRLFVFEKLNNNFELFGYISVCFYIFTWNITIFNRTCLQHQINETRIEIIIHFELHHINWISNILICNNIRLFIKRVTTIVDILILILDLADVFYEFYIVFYYYWSSFFLYANRSVWQLSLQIFKQIFVVWFI